MNEDAIADLKQFIAVTVKQATSDLATKTDLEEVKAELQSVKVTVEKTNLRLDTFVEALNEQSDDHKHRLTKLEARTA
jgi:outer membrane protein TolC